jgi:hypothetical protein
MGVPTVVVASEAFGALARQVADELQTPDARVCVVPHPIGGTAEDRLEEWAESALDELLRLLA